MTVTMDYLDQVLQSCAKFAFFAGKTEDGQIREAEAELGICFPEDYRIFLKRYGALTMGGLEIYGILKEPLQSVPDMVWTTEALRERGLPAQYVPVGFDGFGGYYCLDTESTAKTGISPVVLKWLAEEANAEESTEAEQQFAPDETEWIAESFTEFLFGMLREEVKLLREEESRK